MFRDAGHGRLTIRGSPQPQESRPALPCTPTMNLVKAVAARVLLPPVSCVIRVRFKHSWGPSVTLGTVGIAGIRGVLLIPRQRQPQEDASDLLLPDVHLLFVYSGSIFYSEI